MKHAFPKSISPLFGPVLFKALCSFAEQVHTYYYVDDAKLYSNRLYCGDVLQNDIHEVLK